MALDLIRWTVGAERCSLCAPPSCSLRFVSLSPLQPPQLVFPPPSHAVFLLPTLTVSDPSVLSCFYTAPSSFSLLVVYCCLHFKCQALLTNAAAGVTQEPNSRQNWSFTTCVFKVYLKCKLTEDTESAVTINTSIQQTSSI